MSTRGWRRPVFSLAREEHDGHPWAGPLAAVGLAAGLAMALLGLPPLDLHGPPHYAGVMDPLCGGTRAAHALLRGQFATAWQYNPAVYVLVPGAVLALIRAVAGRITGRWLNLHIHRARPALFLAVLPLAALEANQQAHADLLGTSADTGLPAGLVLYAAVLPLVAAVLVLLLLLRRRSVRVRP